MMMTDNDDYFFLKSTEDGIPSNISYVEGQGMRWFKSFNEDNFFLRAPALIAFSGLGMSKIVGNERYICVMQVDLIILS